MTGHLRLAYMAFCLALAFAIWLRALSATIWPGRNRGNGLFLDEQSLRFELARERMLMCRLYLGLIRSINEDYGAAFAAQTDSSTLRTIGMYVFLRTVMCSPVGASKIASALKLPRVIVVRRLQEMVKQGYVERLGNAYVVTDKVNIPDLKQKLQRRIDMIVEAAKKLTEVNTPPWPADAAPPLK